MTIDVSEARPPTEIAAPTEAGPPTKAAPPAEAGPPTKETQRPDVSHAKPQRWERPALGALLVATAVLYMWGLGQAGWANSFYSAASQAGSASWKAWFFGASDAAGSITVDKPPASLWLTGLSVRAFGLNSWSLLVPQALMGMGTVALVWATVRRWASAHAALLAGLVMATTPVATLMFRFNNPDALLTLLLVASAYTTLRGIEDGRRRWVIATGVMLGFAFLTKQLQMMLVVPVFGGAWLIAAPKRFGRRLLDLLIGGAAMVMSAGWWIAIVQLWPTNSRPYIGGSQTNSILELTLGYNGLGRLTGNETGSVGGGGPGGGAGGSMWGATGFSRLLDGAAGGQIAWLIPAACVGLVAGLWLTRSAKRTDVRRAALLVWGGWLVVTFLTFSFMAGIFHDYYTVALAPAIAVLIGLGVQLLWDVRHSLTARITLALTIAGSAGWAIVLLRRAPGWNSWLIPVIGALGLGSAIVIMLPTVPRRVLVGAGAAGAIAVLAGPLAWSIETAAHPRTGSIVTAGPNVQGSQFRFPGGAAGRGSPPPGRGAAPDGRAGLPPGGPGARPGGQAAPPPGGQGALPGAGGRPGRTNGATGKLPAGFPGGISLRGLGGAGGLLDSAKVSAEVAAVLLENADHYTWVAAGVGSNRAAGFQLATERPVMPIGGFNGSDPSPTLAQFQRYVANGDIHWFISGGGRVGGFNNQQGGSEESSAIASWVTTHFEPTTIDGVTLYNLNP